MTVSHSADIDTKIAECTDREATRYGLKYVHLEATAKPDEVYLTATDSRILVAVKTAGAHDGTDQFIPPSVIPPIPRSGVARVELGAEWRGMVCKPGKPPSTEKVAPIPENPGQWPRLESCMFEHQQAAAVVTLNAELLLKLARAINSQSSAADPAVVTLIIPCCGDQEPLQPNEDGSMPIREVTCEENLSVLGNDEATGFGVIIPWSRGHSTATTLRQWNQQVRSYKDRMKPAESATNDAPGTSGEPHLNYPPR